MRQRIIDLIFHITLWLKGLLAVAEVASGMVVGTASKETLLRLGLMAANKIPGQQPRDVVAAVLFHAVQGLSIGAKLFAAIYLVSHGVIKLWLIVGLLRREVHYYPVAMVVFAVFMAYQLYRYTLTHEPWLIFLTVLDAVVIALTWNEYRYMRPPMRSRSA